MRDKVSPLLPQGEYQLYLQNRGMADPNSRLGQWSQAQFPRLQQLYQAAQLQNPELTWRRFLHTSGPGKLKGQFLGLSPSQRGASQQGRSSVISWG